MMIAGSLAFGCGESDDTIASRARREGMYDPGTPRFEFEAMPGLHNGVPAARCDVEIPFTSLVFVRSGPGLVARYELRLRLASEFGGAALSEVSWQDSVRKDSAASPGSVRISGRWIDGREGEIGIEAVLEDLSSNRTAVRSQRLELYPSNDSTPRILRPVLRMTRGNEEIPVLSPQVPLGLPGFHALCEFRNLDRISPNESRIVLLRFPIDTLPASPPHFLNSLPSTLRRNGIDVRKPDTLWSRSVVPGASPLFLERVPLEGMRAGVYEIVLRVPAADLEQRRLIVRVDRDFPRCVRLRSIVDPLVYLLPRSRFEEFAEVMREDSLRALFERTWLEFGGNPDGASNLIRTFAERIEQANISFSTFREGWKSDLGMVSIVFGPPAYVEREFKKERWVYGSGLLFTFEQAITRRGDALVENWVLLRDAGYERYWEKELDRWRNGRVF